MRDSSCAQIATPDMTPAILLFTDVVDSTLLVERLGDERAAQVWAAHDRCARDLMALHQGREIDRTDGFFLLFDAVADAARYAMAYHEALVGLALQARVGLHVGPVSHRENPAPDVARGAKRIEVEGLAKPFAARIMALARGGQTLLSAMARTALGNHVPEGAVIESHGHYRLKGVDAPVEVFELGLRSASAFLPPPDADKAYRVVRRADLWHPLREVRHNLPAERDAFVGRSAELRGLAQRLDAGTRLLTVLGPGGTGKTRFVRRYALAWLGDWPGGVCFCDLSEARTLDGIHFAVACALGVPLGQADPSVRLGHAIAGRGRCLLILDNFEQLVAHAPGTLGHWLDRAAEAAFIVTSRERLHLGGEEVFPIEPLAIASEGVELFEVRARAQRPEFRVGADNRSAVAEVVRLLDGLPLAIELAAARVRVLSPAQIVERMADRFRLLAGARGAAARQATLKAAIDWSWDLLTAWEQAALALCSVFEGGFTLEAAEAVLDLRDWPDAPAPMDAVQALVDKSLLRVWSPAGQSRFGIDEPYFGMYLSIHEYALGKLHDVGPEATRRAEQRHSRYFATFGSEEAIDALSLRGGTRRRHVLALEIDNLVAACRRALLERDANVAALNFRAAWEVMCLHGPFGPAVLLGEQVLGLEGTAPLTRVQAMVCWTDALMRVGRLDDASSLLERLLVQTAGGTDRRLEGIVRANLGMLYIEQGRMDAATPCLEAALAIFTGEGRRLGQGGVLLMLGNLHDMQGAAAASRSCLESALAIYREIGNNPGTGDVLASLAILNRHQGRMEQAQACYQSALVILREVGNRRVEGIVLGNLGNLLMDQGHVEQAQWHFEAALTIHREVGSRVVESYVLDSLGGVHRHHGRLDDARLLFDQALAICHEVDNQYHAGHVLCSLSALDLLQGRLDQAADHIDAAVRVNQALGNRLSEGVALSMRGELRLQQRRVEEARQALRQGEALLRAIDNPFELANLLCIVVRAELAGADPAAARAAMAEAEAIARQIGATPGSGLMRGIALVRALLL